MRAYQPARIAYSPERIPIDFQSYRPPQKPETIQGNAGLRRRPSNQPAGRSQSSGPYDRERPSFSESGSRRALRSRDGYYREDERFQSNRRDDYHPDAYERSRPPRSYRNAEAWDRFPGSASKPYFEETKVDRVISSVENGA